MVQGLRVNFSKRYTVDFIRLPHAKPPKGLAGWVFAYFGAQTNHGLAKADGLTDRLIGEVLPASSSIIFAETSVEAMMLYCGEVEVCIMKASLNNSGLTGTLPEQNGIAKLA